MPASVVETAVLARTLGFGSEYESAVKSELRLKKKELLNVFAEVAKRPVDGQTLTSGARTSQDALRMDLPGSSEVHSQDLSQGHPRSPSPEPIDTRGDAQ